MESLIFKQAKRELKKNPNSKELQRKLRIAQINYNWA